MLSHVLEAGRPSEHGIVSSEPPHHLHGSILSVGLSSPLSYLTKPPGLDREALPQWPHLIASLCRSPTHQHCSQVKFLPSQYHYMAHGGLDHTIPRYRTIFRPRGRVGQSGLQTLPSVALGLTIFSLCEALALINTTLRRSPGTWTTWKRIWYDNPYLFLKTKSE